MLVPAALLFGFRPTGNGGGDLDHAAAAGGAIWLGLAFAALVMLMREANTLVDVAALIQILSAPFRCTAAAPAAGRGAAALTYGLTRCATGCWARARCCRWG
jgi:hypothetical protein